MARLDGWEAGLNAAIDEARGWKYDLGKRDCFRLVCNVVKALTGEDRWSEVRGYKTRRQALARIAVYGKTFEDAGDGFFRGPRIPWAMAQRGDIVAFATVDGQKHLGVCVGATFAGVTDEGLIFTNMSAAICAWRIG